MYSTRCFCYLCVAMSLLLFMGLSILGLGEILCAEYNGRARNLSNLANKKDGLKVISAFAQLQSTCLNCHGAYRKSFQKHFYGVD